MTEYRFDYQQARPNRFAGKPKEQRQVYGESSLGDEDLARLADAVFVELDRSEADKK